jgi:hypothetical protein
VNTAFTEAAQRGYDFLVAKAWQWDFDVSRLNPDTLDVSSGHDCALSQAAGTMYWHAIQRLADEGYPVTDGDMLIEIEDSPYGASAIFSWERAHGFRLQPGIPFSPEAYDELTQAWREVIKKARDGGDDA